MLTETHVLPTAQSPAFNAANEGEPLPDVLEVEEDLHVDSRTGLLGLVEILLKQPARADRLNGDPVLQTHLIPRFLAIALTSYALFSVAVLLLLN